MAQQETVLTFKLVLGAYDSDRVQDIALTDPSNIFVPLAIDPDIVRRAQLDASFDLL